TGASRTQRANPPPSSERGGCRKPSILRFNSLFERHGRGKAKIGPGQRRVCEGVTHASLLDRLPPNVQRAANDAADDVEHLVDRHPRSTTDVVGPAWHAAVSGRSGRRHGVAHEGEISSLLAIAIKMNGIPGNGSADEPVKSHVRPLPGPIYREISE